MLQDSKCTLIYVFQIAFTLRSDFWSKLQKKLLHIRTFVFVPLRLSQGLLLPIAKYFSDCTTQYGATKHQSKKMYNSQNRNNDLVS